MDTRDPRTHSLRPIWDSLILTGSRDLTDALWRTAITEIAKAALVDIRSNLSASAPEVAQVDGPANPEYDPDDLVQDWLYESLPRVDELAELLGEFEALDFFRERGLAWYEQIDLPGDLDRGDPDVIWDLEQRDSLLRGLITEEMLNEFYQEWRASFLRRVQREALALGGKGRIRS